MQNDTQSSMRCNFRIQKATISEDVSCIDKVNQELAAYIFVLGILIIIICIYAGVN